MEPVSVMQKIAPDMLKIIERRYKLLRTVYYTCPIGRRALAAKVNVSERTVRKELELLEDQGLVVGTAAGMQATPAGEQVLVELKEYIREMYGLGELENELCELLSMDTVIVVPGDSDQDEVVKKDMARATARYLRGILRDGDTLAVTGGTTLSQVAECFPADTAQRQIIVVPARGGLGENVNIQANSVAARLADRLGGQYRLLHAPDNVAPSLVDTIMREPRIRDVLSLMRRSNVLLHGIGTAEEMARRRGMDDTTVMHLIADGAVGEAFGYYFDVEGNIVYSMPSVGLRMEELQQIPLVVAVGGGKSKAWAVLSVANTGYCDVCITDEGAARRLMSIKRLKEDVHNGS